MNWNDWDEQSEKELEELRKKAKEEFEERTKAEIEVNRKLLPYDFGIGIFLFVVLIVVVAIVQPPAPVCGSYEQVAASLRDTGYWVDATGNPPNRFDLLYQHYKSQTDEKVVLVDYRPGKETCIVDCANGQCDNIRPWLQTYR